MKYFLYFFLPSPTSILYPSTSPLISVFDSSQLSGSINVQDGGETSFLKKKKRVMDRAAKYACFAGYASRASLTRPRPRPRASSLALCFQPRSWPFVWLFARTWIRKNTDCFAVEKLSIQIMAKNVVRSCESASNVHGLTCREDLKEA